MQADTKRELYSLAEFVGAGLSDLLSLARLAAGDERLVSIEDLTEHGAREVIHNLRLYSVRERDWLAELVESV